MVSHAGNVLPLKIPVTDKALVKIMEYKTLLSISDSMGVRFKASQEGAKLVKSLGFDEKKFTDQHFEIKGIQVFIDRRELKHFEYTQLDFRETSTEKGFVFRTLAAKEN